MRRVLILGCSGAGKSTFARRLAERTGLPLVHLDQLYWQPGWQEPNPDEWRTTVERELAREFWIMDGHMGGTIPLRLRAADTAIFFDFPMWICLRRVAWRVWRGYGSVRQDMAEGCPERFDLAFLRFILGFRRTRRPGVLKALADFDGELVVFKKPRDAKNFLAGVGAAVTQASTGGRQDVLEKPSECPCIEKSVSDDDRQRFPSPGVEGREHEKLEGQP